MEKRKLSNDELKTIVVSAVTFVVGVLFCCGLAMQATGLSIIIGASVIAGGLVYIVNSLLQKKALLSFNGLIGAALISLGVFFIIGKLAMLVVAFIPYLLIGVGAIVLIEAFLAKFVRKDTDILKFVILLVLGACSLTLGIVLLCVDSLMYYAALFFGIVLIIYALYSIIMVFAKPKTEN